MTPHASNEGTPTPRTDAAVACNEEESVYKRYQRLHCVARTLERENQSLARRVGELEGALKPFAEMAKYRTFPFHGQMQAMQANPNTATEPGFQLFYSDFYRASDALAASTINQGDKA